MSPNWFKKIFYLGVGLFSVGLYLHTIVEFQQDLGRHLLLGKIIWETRHIPLTNLFSYTHPDFNFYNMHWLPEVIFYLISRQSLTSLLAFKTLIAGSAVLLSVLTAFRFSKNLLATTLAFIGLSPVLLERTELRPEIFSYLFTALFTFFLIRSLETKSFPRTLFLLPIIEILWVNCHIYFFLGPVLVAFFTAHHLLCGYLKHASLVKALAANRNYLTVFALVCLATIINPHGLSGALYPLRVFENYGYTIVENQTIFFLEALMVNPNIQYFKFGAMLLLLSFGVTNFHDRFFPLKLMSLAFLALPLQAIRSLPFLYLIFMPILAHNLAHLNSLASSLLKRYLFQPYLPIVLFGFCLALVFIRGLRLTTNDYALSLDTEKRFGFEILEKGRRSADFLLKNNLPQPIFNNFDIGGYLDYRLFPKYRVFIDNRPGEYPAAFFQDVYIPMQKSRDNFDAADRRYNFKTIIFAHTDGTPWAQSFMQMINHHPDWSLVYFDDYAVIYLKNTELSQSLNPLVQSTYFLPTTNRSYLSYLSYGRFFSVIGWRELAVQSFKKAYELNPSSPLTNQAMATIFPSLYQYHPSLPLF